MRKMIGHTGEKDRLYLLEAKNEAREKDRLYLLEAKSGTKYSSLVSYLSKVLETSYREDDLGIC